MNDGSAGRRAILQVCWGTMAFRKAILEPGKVLRVGRDKDMDFALPHDSKLAGAHFELSWDGAKCQIRDLKTTTGTLLNGRPIKAGIISHGNWIRAGMTDFLTYFERATPPLDTKQPSISPMAAHQALALDILRSQQTSLYALVDAACSERILELLHESVEEYQSLYEGHQGAALAAVAPFLVSLSQKDSWLLKALVQEGWESNWGVYLTSPADFHKVRRHLRKFLMVGAEGVENRLYFRFYDPRVLNCFLSTRSSQESKEFFGDVEKFIFNNSDGSVIEALSLGDKHSPGRHEAKD